MYMYMSIGTKHEASRFVKMRFHLASHRLTFGHYGKITAMTNTNRLGWFIKQAREAKGWTQDDLAERLDVGRGYIGQLETGVIKLPGIEKLALLEQHLGVSREEMLRAAGRLGPTQTFDVVAELRRIRAIPDREQRARALQELPEDVVAALEDTAMEIVSQAIRLQGR